MTGTRAITSIGLVFLALASVLLTGTTAEARRRGRRGNGIQGVRFDLHATFAWHGQGGAGGRMEFALAPRGFIDGFHDDLALSLGAELLFYNYDDRSRDNHGLIVVPLAALQWNWYFSRTVSVFPEVGLAFTLGHGWYHRHDHRPGDADHSHVFVDPFAGFGLRLHFGRRGALLLRMGWPIGLQVGLNF